MAQRYFHEGLAQNPETKAHMTVMDNDKPVHLPIVGGVVSIPDNLAQRVVIGPDWTRYTGQVPASDDDLKPVENIDEFYNGKKKAAASK